MILIDDAVWFNILDTNILNNFYIRNTEKYVKYNGFERDNAKVNYSKMEYFAWKFTFNFKDFSNFYIEFRKYLKGDVWIRFTAGYGFRVLFNNEEDYVYFLLKFEK